MIREPDSTANRATQHWQLNPDTVFLNHGSFGACPTPVLDYQQSLRERIEHQPVQFYVRDMEPMLDDARVAIADFVGADAQDIAWVPNATTGVNAVLQSLHFKRGDELLVTDHEYNACRNVLEFVARRDEAKVVVVKLPFPVSDSALITEALVSGISSKTRLLLLDHVTSQTGLVLPLRDILSEFRTRGIQTLVDAAHAPGMIDVDLGVLAPDFYTANCHKWICAPKGSGFLYVERSRQAEIRPPVISHGANTRRTDRSKFLVEFDWPGTWDPTAVLSVPAALRSVAGFVPGGWPVVRKLNHDLLVKGRALICDALGIEAPCPEGMLGALAAVALPPGAGAASTSALYGDPLQDTLLNQWNIEVPIVPWPAHPQRLLRISAQLYNDLSDYELLSDALRVLFPRTR